MLHDGSRIGEVNAIVSQLGDNLLPGLQKGGKGEPRWLWSVEQAYVNAGGAVVAQHVLGARIEFLLSKRVKGSPSTICSACYFKRIQDTNAFEVRKGRVLLVHCKGSLVGQLIQCRGNFALERRNALVIVSWHPFTVNKPP